MKNDKKQNHPEPSRRNSGAKRGEWIEYTVIAGELKGRKIAVPDLGITRPPLTRLRKSIFDFLTPYLEEAAYLDLYSGSGAYLFEAVSRHAAQVVGVERNPQLAEAINAHAIRFGVGERMACRCQDVFAAIPELHQRGLRFDIIMMAPPQYVGLVSQTLAALKEKPLTSGTGMIICQHDSSETKGLVLDGYQVEQQRKYGNSTYTILKPE